MFPVPIRKHMDPTWHPTPPQKTHINPVGWILFLNPDNKHLRIESALSLQILLILTDLGMSRQKSETLLTLQGSQSVHETTIYRPFLF